MTRRAAMRIRTSPNRTARRSESLPPQGAVDLALDAFVTAAEAGEVGQMQSALSVVEAASEQQVQCAMLYVQRSRQISRGALLRALAG